MRIGILTFHWATNYGAVLQSFSLQQALLQKSIECEIINYYPDKFKKKLWRCFLTKHPQVIKNRITEYRREKQISPFRQNYLLQTPHFSGADQMKKTDFDGIICGSDQVWNESFIRHGERKKTFVYFLDFVPMGVRKFSYAASFGCDCLSGDLRTDIQNNLKSFSMVSVRENSGKKIAEDLGIPCELVPDPTLLFDGDWYAQKLSVGYNNESPYILQYVLHGQNGKAEKFYRKNFLEFAKKQVGDLGVLQWLQAIRNAHTVITNSYHGMVFSILFHREFYVMTIKGSGMNDRILTLLEKLELTDRIVDDENAYFLPPPIDWILVEEKLRMFRETGWNYLNRVREKSTDIGSSIST